MISFMLQHGPSSMSMGGTNNLNISSFEDVQARAHIPANPQQSDTHDLKAEKIKTISLPESTRTIASTGIEENKGIRITVNRKTSVITAKGDRPHIPYPHETYFVTSYILALTSRSFKDFPFLYERIGGCLNIWRSVPRYRSMLVLHCEL